MKKKAVPALGILFVFCSLVIAGNVSAAEKPWLFGLLLVGPYNDRGYSQAHYEGGKYVEKTVPGTQMIYIDKVNPADRPGVTIPQLADDMAEKGVKLIIANSDDMKDGIREAAVQHPDIYFIHCSGDDVLTGKAPKKSRESVRTHGIRENDGRFCRGHDHKNRKNRLSRAPDQRRNAASCGFFLSGREIRLGNCAEKKSR